MALIVETGTGLANADALCSVEYANAYHKSMGNDSWLNYSTPQKEIFIRRGTMYLRNIYRSSWKGVRAHMTQKQDWPRANAERDGFVIAVDEIPSEVMDATAILALKAADGPLSPDLERAVIREKVGELEVEYDDASPQETRYAEVEALLAPLLQRSSNSIKLVRA